MTISSLTVVGISVAMVGSEVSSTLSRGVVGNSSLYSTEVVLPHHENNTALIDNIAIRILFMIS